MRERAAIIPVEVIERRIFLIRGQKVMLDRDLAELYGVATKVFNQAVRRNLDRFPEDFTFQLTKAETAALRSQTVTLKKGRGRYSKYAAFAFTENGVAILSSILRSKRAVAMNILIIRAFVRLRERLATHKDLARKMEKLEQRQTHQAVQINTILKHLIEAPKKPEHPIGFVSGEGN
jgi:phage regulator Rha-like protein